MLLIKNTFFLNKKMHELKNYVFNKKIFLRNIYFFVNNFILSVFYEYIA
jgi:hypothetical protein